MVFSSIPAYLDPVNWQQQQPNFQTGSSGLLSPPQRQQPIPPPQQPQPHGAGGAGSIRPGSMADRARMANVPMPETALKCPRCESTHTKFCYFNNYSLSQPRHFCKTCRRYWTRGGALRSVPVGGGCRRNKRSSKGSCSNSKSEQANSETANSDYGPGHELGLNHGGISAPLVTTTSEMNFQIGSNLFSGGGDGVASLLPSSGGGLDQWQRMHHAQQFPNFLGGFDPSISQGGVLYHNNNNYQAGGVDQASGSGYVGAKLSSSSSLMSQLQASVKMEANNNSNINNQSNLARQFSGSVQGNEQHWSTGAAAWTDLSGFTSSPTSNAL